MEKKKSVSGDTERKEFWCIIENDNRERRIAMDYSVLETSSLFRGIPAKELRDDLEKTSHHEI